MDYGFWSVVPPLLTIALAIITKEVLLSLFIGIYTGCFIAAGCNPLGAVEEMSNMMIGSYDDEENVIAGVLSDPGDVQIIVIVVLLGGLIGLLVQSGGSRAFGEMIVSKVKTPKGAQVVTWAMGMLIFFDDYFNALTTGSVMRPVNDKMGISREKTSYIVDSTAAGICVISPISSFIAFTCSLIYAAYKDSNLEGNAYTEFLKTIPYNYYAWLALFMVLIVVLLKLDFGPMAKAEKRARETGMVCEKTFAGGDADEDDFAAIEPANGKAWHLIAPVVTLVVLDAVLILYTGGFFSGASFLDAIKDMDGMKALMFAIMFTLILTFLMLTLTRLVKFGVAMQAFIVGTKSIIYVIIMLAFAWGIGEVSTALGTAEYVISLIGESFPTAILPLIIFGVACIMTFATGAEWGTWAIMVPIAVPLAVSTGINPVICISAVLGGGLYGGHCSPLSDMIVLTSASCNVRHIDHVKTQVPYSTVCACCAAVGYICSGFMGNWYIPLAVTFATFFVAVFILNRFFGEKRYSIEEIKRDIDTETE